MDPASFLQGRTRETKIRRDVRGRWFNDQDPVDHPNLVRCFNGWIDRAEDGRFCLSNDINWAYIEIEGAPYLVRDLNIDGNDVHLSLTGEREELLDPATLRVDAHGVLWCAVREGRCPACFDTHAANKLGDLIDEDEEGMFLRLAGGKVRPASIADPLRLGVAS